MGLMNSFKDEVKFLFSGKVLGMSLAAFSMKMRGQRNFTEKNKENLIAIFDKPIEYLLARD